jgi:hypothetical protein
MEHDWFKRLAGNAKDRPPRRLAAWLDSDALDKEEGYDQSKPWGTAAAGSIRGRGRRICRLAGRSP